MRFFLLLIVTFSFPQLTWPPDTCNCAPWHRDYIESHPDCPDNEIVTVSRNGGSNTISFNEFLNQVGKSDSKTYVIQASSDPYIMGCRQVNIGGWSASSKRSCIIIKGGTGNREDVVIAGADPATDPDFWHSSEYGGSSSCGIYQVFQIVNAQHIVFADLTLRNFAGKMIKIDGGNTWAPEDIRIHNVELWDCGSQMIKVAGEPVSSRNCILECSYLHYTDGLFTGSTYETQGIDVHEGHHWIIRDNLFENIRQESSKANGAAILMWDNTDSVFSYRNMIINCNSAIKYGATWYLDGSDAMWAWNNVIVYDDPDPTWFGGNVIDVGQDVSSGGIFHNTIWNAEQRGTEALVVCSNQYPFENNIYVQGTTHRCNGLQNNIQVQDSSVFISVGKYDFHLKEDKPVPAVTYVQEDLDGKNRGTPASAGAYEYETDVIEQKQPFTWDNGIIIKVLGNPFTAQTRIIMENTRNSFPVQASIYNINGKPIESVEQRQSGMPYKGVIVLHLNGLDLPSGIYILRIKIQGYQKEFSKKINLVK